MAEGLEDLYAVDPGDFVAARNELVKRLKKAGDKEAATEVAKLRRPSPAAWAVNQLARRHRTQLEDLVHKGESLRAAQDRALAGGEAVDLRKAGRRRRDALARLAELAEALLVERGGSPGAHAAEVAATLEAASLDEEAADAVLAGRLTTELQPPSGFGAFDVPDAAVRERPSRPEPPAQAGPSDKEVDAAGDAVDEARRKWQELSAKSRDAVDRVDEARRTVRKAEAEVATLEDQLADAERRRRAAVRDAEQAEDRASRAEDATSRAAERLRAAEKRLADLSGD